MKSLFIKSLLLIFIACASDQSTDLKYNLLQNYKSLYTFQLESRPLNFSQDIEFTLKTAENGQLAFDAAVTKMYGPDAGLLSNNTNVPLQFTLDNKGKIIKNLTDAASGSDASGAFNLRLFFPMFPEKLSPEGATWKTESAISDMIFKKMTSNYTLKEINDTATTIEVINNFTADEKSFTKTFKGLYTIDSKTGELLSGTLDISGFNGFSNISGKITIKKN